MTRAAARGWPKRGRTQIVRPRPLVSRPRVSVVIPCYNYGHFLPDAVHSVLNQRGVDLEVIIVDDASSDASLEVARQLAAEDSRIEVVEHQENQGHIASYNDGLSRASGEYLLLLSADDLLTPGSIERSVGLLEANPSVGFAYGFSQEFETEPPPARVSVRNWSIWPGQRWLRECFKQGKNFVYTPEVVMRAVAYRELGGYEPRLPHAADFFLWMRTAARWDVGRVNGADQAYYRVHGNNMHLTSFSGVITDLRERRNAFEYFLAVDHSLLSNPAEMRELANKAMAGEAVRLATASIDGNCPDFVAANEFTDEANSLDPLVSRYLRWSHYRRAHKRATSGSGPGIEQRVARLVRSMEEKLRWRRWRWSGQ